MRHNAWMITHSTSNITITSTHQVAPHTVADFCPSFTSGIDEAAIAYKPRPVDSFVVVAGVLLILFDRHFLVLAKRFVSFII